MPIRPSKRERYPKDWRAISARIRERDGNKCKWCDAPNGASIVRLVADPSRWRLAADVAWMYPDDPNRARYQAPIQVVLTVAHLNHQPEDCRDENLAALCQRCHLQYDRKHHMTNAAATRRSKRPGAVGDFFGGK